MTTHYHPDYSDYTVTTQHSFLDGLIYALTCGIYTPTTTTVRSNVYSFRGYLLHNPDLDHKFVEMKKSTLILGIVLLLIGFIQGIRYFFDYHALTQYGKGYVWGSFFLFLLGVSSIYIGLRKKKNTTKKLRSTGHLKNA